MKLEGLQNYQRIKRIEVLGDFHSAHILNTAVQFNYNDTENFHTFTPSATKPYLTQVDMNQQKCAAVRFRFFDTPVPPATTTAQAFSLTEIAMEIGLKDTLFKTGNRAS